MLRTNQVTGSEGLHNEPATFEDESILNIPIPYSIWNGSEPYELRRLGKYFRLCGE